DPRKRPSGDGVGAGRPRMRHEYTNGAPAPRFASWVHTSPLTGITPLPTIFTQDLPAAAPACLSPLAGITPLLTGHVPQETTRCLCVSAPWRGFRLFWQASGCPDPATFGFMSQPPGG